MRVTHRLTVYAKCPTDDSKPDVYDVTVETEGLLLVEVILEAVEKLTKEPIFQEDLTDRLARRLGNATTDVTVTTVGQHFNRVETTVEVEG